MGRLTHGIWFAVQGAARGRSHIQDGTECQDKTCILRKNGVLAVALSDGAGTAAYSGNGAETVVRSICDLLCTRFDDIYGSPKAAAGKRMILDCILSRLEDTADRLQCSLRDLSSTLLAVAVSGGRFLAVHLGDGVIVYTRNGDVSVLTRPQNGEYANTTYFVTSACAEEKMRLLWAGDTAIDGFALMSDGTAAGLYDKRSAQPAPVLGRLIQRLSVTSEEFLMPILQDSLENVLIRRTADDCSLVIAAFHRKAYPNLTKEERNAFFGVSAYNAEIAKRISERYISLMNALDRPRTEQSLAKEAGLSISSFRRRVLLPLVSMGYIKQEESQRYVRTVHPLPEHGIGDSVPLLSEKPDCSNGTG